MWVEAYDKTEPIIRYEHLTKLYATLGKAIPYLRFKC